MPAKRRKHIPLRRCIACRERYPKRELIRIVRTSEGTIEIDLKGKRSGRGAYLCRKQQCLETALQPQRLSQALKCRVSAKDVAALQSLAPSLIEEAVSESQTVPLQGAGAEE
jgi:predicted RNA-binding protein YlxR (DUF448 family)